MKQSCFQSATPTSNNHFKTHIIAFRLLQRYQNMKKELEAQQNLERINMDKLTGSIGLYSSGKRDNTRRRKLDGR